MQRRRFLAAAAAALHVAPAAAQDAPAEAARRELIARAEAASDAGDHAAALALALRAAEARMTPSLALLLAQEHDALGHAVEALDAAGRCARDAEADASIRNRDRVLSACRALAASLGGRVARLTVRLEAPPEGLRVTVGGRALDPAALGAPVTVAPGRVELSAEAPGRAPFRRELSLAAGGEAAVTVALVAPAASPRADVIVTPPAQPPAATSRGPGAGPWVLAGVGALALGAGVAFWRLQESSVDARDAAAQRADRAGALDHDDDARTWNLATNVAYGVGAAALAGGVTWWLLARPSSRAAARTAFHVGAAPVAGGAVLAAGGAL